MMEELAHSAVRDPVRPGAADHSFPRTFQLRPARERSAPNDGCDASADDGRYLHRGPPVSRFQLHYTRGGRRRPDAGHLAEDELTGSLANVADTRGARCERRGPKSGTLIHGHLTPISRGPIQGRTACTNEPAQIKTDDESIEAPNSKLLSAAAAAAPARSSETQKQEQAGEWKRMKRVGNLVVRPKNNRQRGPANYEKGGETVLGLPSPLFKFLNWKRNSPGAPSILVSFSPRDSATSTRWASARET